MPVPCALVLHPLEMLEVHVGRYDLTNYILGDGTFEGHGVTGHRYVRWQLKQDMKGRTDKWSRHQTDDNNGLINCYKVTQNGKFTYISFDLQQCINSWNELKHDILYVCLRVYTNVYYLVFFNNAPN